MGVPKSPLLSSFSVIKGNPHLQTRTMTRVTTYMSGSYFLHITFSSHNYRFARSISFPINAYDSRFNQFAFFSV